MSVWTLRFIFLLVIWWTAVSKAETQLGRLRQKLLEGYNKNNRPVKDEKDTVHLKFAYHIRHLTELDIKTETLSAEGVIEMQWDDQFLVWNPKDYGNISYINLADHEVWQPDIFLYRCVGKNMMDDDKSTYVSITSEGRVFWTPPASLKVPCVTSYRNYPFEKHWCEFEFGSWGSNGDSLHLQSIDNFKLDAPAVTGGEWHVTDWSLIVKSHVVIDKYPYNSINLTLAVQRTTSIQEITAVVPTVTSSVLTLAGFWLDVWSPSRYVLGLGNFGVVAFQLMHLGMTLKTGRDIPLIVQFSATVSCMAALFMILTVLFDSMQSQKGSPPEGLFRFCKALPEKALCLAEETDRPEQESSAQTMTAKASRDWNLICRVFDKIFFWIFALVYVLVISLMISIG